jgi:hypothetical protein
MEMALVKVCFKILHFCLLKIFNTYIAKAVIIGKVHHGLMDGMGTLLLLASVDGNKNMPAIPQMKDISILMKTFLFVLSPIFFAFSLFADLTVKNDANPFTLKNGFSGRKQLAVSQTYSFEDLRYCYKKYPSIKFNDFVLGCVGVAIRKYTTKLGYSNFKHLGE